jgi:DNA (cytosine-5)-methyltransferase 1
MSCLEAIGLFSGSGGLDLGLEQAGFNITASIELDKVRCLTLGSNRHKWDIVNSDIRDISGEELLSFSRKSEIDIIAAGPPCQPFSKSAYWVTEGKVRDLEKSQLIFEPVRIAKEVNARAVLIENVPGLSYKHAKPMLDKLLDQLMQAGYNTTWKIVDAADYGVPQHRKRLIIMGLKEMDPVLPLPTHGNGQDYVSTGDAIGDLDDGLIYPDEEIKGKHGHLLSLIPPGQNYIYLTERGNGTTHFKYRSKYWSFLLKLSPERPAWTIPASAGPYTGPFHWNSRKLRIPELKRLQTIPDDWVFCGSENSIRRQIGDAVPSLLAQKIGEQMIRQLTK